MVFRVISAYSCIDLKEDSIKRECYETVPANRHLFIDDLIQLDVQSEKGLEIRFTVNCVTEGACLLVTRCNFSRQLCPLDTPLHLYIYIRDRWKNSYFQIIVHFHSLSIWRSIQLEFISSSPMKSIFLSPLEQVQQGIWVSYSFFMIKNYTHIIKK